ncbi:hypothetical protein VTO73DRAFT_2398 [Trametes versicolor]
MPAHASSSLFAPATFPAARPRRYTAQNLWLPQGDGLIRVDPMKHASKEHSSPGGYPAGFVKALKQDLTVAIVERPMEPDLDSSRHQLLSRSRLHRGAGIGNGRPPPASQLDASWCEVSISWPPQMRLRYHLMNSSARRPVRI